MTIHQAKGLEFPVVVVGSLSNQLSSAKGIDRDLRSFYHRPPFEPESRITLFDRMRLHYVAFSRPQKLLVLTAHERPKDHFASIWQGLPQWPYVEKELLAAQRFAFRERMPVKKSYSFTGDLRIYETCPRQYQFFREYDFTPSRSAVIFFGLLVHQTIEEIHRIALDGKLDTLDEARIRELFDRSFRFLCLSDVRPIGNTARQSAFRQVMNYFRQNREEMRRVIQTEVDVSLEKEGYILIGKVDLLLGGDGKLSWSCSISRPRRARRTAPRCSIPTNVSSARMPTSWSDATANGLTGCCSTGRRRSGRTRRSWPFRTDPSGSRRPAITLTKWLRGYKPSSSE
jgi:DNA helicase-2/ATP-dependent DNA helicase PcrA